MQSKKIQKKAKLLVIYKLILNIFGDYDRSSVLTTVDQKILAILRNNEPMFKTLELQV